MQNPDQTEMVSASKQTRMAAPKLVQIEALAPLFANNQHYKAGDKLEVSEELAHDFCKPIQGFADHSGESSARNLKYYQHIRAKRIQAN
jgi:hypothetical protein